MLVSLSISNPLFMSLAQDHVNTVASMCSQCLALVLLTSWPLITPWEDGSGKGTCFAMAFKKTMLKMFVCLFNVVYIITDICMTATR